MNNIKFNVKCTIGLMQEMINTITDKIKIGKLHKVISVYHDHSGWIIYDNYTDKKDLIEKLDQLLYSVKSKTIIIS